MQKSISRHRSKGYERKQSCFDWFLRFDQLTTTYKQYVAGSYNGGCFLTVTLKGIIYLFQLTISFDEPMITSLHDYEWHWKVHGNHLIRVLKSFDLPHIGQLARLNSTIPFFALRKVGLLYVCGSMKNNHLPVSHKVGV